MTFALSLTHVPLDPFDSPSNWEQPIQRRSGSKDERIKRDGKYLAKIRGGWHLGTFSEQWYGWSFNEWGRSGIQLSSIEDLYEVDLSVLDQ